MPVSPARVSAFNILLRVERDAAYADELLHSRDVDQLSSVDRNLTTEIVMGVLRWRSALDQSIAQLSFTPFRKLDLEVVTALRIGIYQKRFLTRVPAHAAVNETVELVKDARKTSAAGLVNAVMRKVKSGSFNPPSTGLGALEYLASVFAHPPWLLERWIRHYGEEQTRLICEHDQSTPPVTVRLSATEDDETLARDGVRLEHGELLRHARVVAEGGVTATDSFRNGKIVIQDEASQLVAALVGEGRTILDCCAAPGGKTSAMAARLPQAQIVAAEIHPHRARLLRKMAAQPNVFVVAADARQLPFANEFDRVLVDVPCSGTGTLARNPEIKWRLRPDDLIDLQHKQIEILRSAMCHVAHGGRLIYSTCSLEPEENAQVVTECLAQRSEFRIVAVKAELMKLQESGELIWRDIDRLVSGEFLRTIPGVHPCDGFFAAILERS